MHTVPKFNVYEDKEEPEGVFQWGSSRDDLFELFDEARDHFYLGELEQAKQILKRIISDDPHFIDGFSLLGDVMMATGSQKEGFEYHQKAVEVGEKIIPASFEGRIQWGFIENRPFLRALYSHAYDLFTQQQLQESIGRFEEILHYNPNDHQGVRWLIGDLYFLDGDIKAAENIYQKELEYPPYQYSNGLLRFSQNDYTRAVTFFRKGILSNIYISDLIRGKLPLIDYQIWHASNLELPETAYSYLDVMAQKWVEFPNAIDLLNFVHIADPSRSQIEETYLLKQDLYFTDSGFGDVGMADTGFTEGKGDDMRKELIAEIKQIEKEITHESSKMLVKEWKQGSDPHQRHL